MGLIPAHAGKTARATSAARTGGAHPRSRGENGCVHGVAALHEGSSPLTRGKHDLRRHDQDRTGLIPAHAGKTFPRTRPCVRCAAHPRSRGENVAVSGVISKVEGSSPLTRGKRRRSPPVSWGGGLIPAHAGKTCRERQALRRPRAHPRSRGENIHSTNRADSCGGSSPLTRGKQDPPLEARNAQGLIPAHAGKTRRSRPGRSPDGAHPRSRGENDLFLVSKEDTPGSSPLTRGKPRPVILARALAGLIPAHAGKTPPHSRSQRGAWAHPRSRGENPPNQERSWAGEGSSPLTRGKHLRGRGPQPGAGLIPAHAGKTGPFSGRGRRRGAHPRSRGENSL